MLEALFAGVPVVATPTRGANLLLDQGRCGYIAKDFSQTSLAESVRECLIDPKGREERISRARKRAKEFFTLDRMVEKTEAVYRELVKN
jgi:glycosyltransferase involved in cell wall biosynthesis